MESPWRYGRDEHVNAGEGSHQSVYGSRDVSGDETDTKLLKLLAGGFLERRGTNERRDLLLDPLVTVFFGLVCLTTGLTNLSGDSRRPFTMDRPVSPVAPTIATFMMVFVGTVIWLVGADAIDVVLISSKAGGRRLNIPVLEGSGESACQLALECAGFMFQMLAYKVEPSFPRKYLSLFGYDMVIKK